MVNGCLAWTSGAYVAAFSIYHAPKQLYAAVFASDE
jgi:hypothetical protein